MNETTGALIALAVDALFCVFIYFYQKLKFKGEKNDKNKKI